jgi:hypothetical protein
MRIPGLLGERDAANKRRHSIFDSGIVLAAGLGERNRTIRVTACPNKPAVMVQFRQPSFFTENLKTEEHESRTS